MRALSFALALSLTALPVFAQEMGDNTAAQANNGVCDDPRFSGPGVAATPSPEAEGHDAADCGMLLNIGAIYDTTGPEAAACAALVFGDDSSEWANDGECDDPRFEGAGVAFDPSVDDLLHDASDCRMQCLSGGAVLVGPEGRAEVDTSDEEMTAEMVESLLMEAEDAAAEAAEETAENAEPAENAAASRVQELLKQLEAQ